MKKSKTEWDMPKYVLTDADDIYVCHGEISDINDHLQDEDQNNDLYTVLNRIQENLTQPDRLFNEYGNLIDGVNNINDDIRLNKELFELVTIN